MGGPGAPGTEDPGDFSDGEGDLAANTAAQAAARAAFTEDKVGDTFYSSDEDESEDKSSVTGGSFVSGSAASTTEASKKFKVVIKVSVLGALWRGANGWGGRDPPPRGRQGRAYMCAKRGSQVYCLLHGSIQGFY